MCLIPLKIIFTISIESVFQENYYRNDIVETEIAPVGRITGAFIDEKRIVSGNWRFR